MKFKNELSTTEVNGVIILNSEREKDNRRLICKPIRQKENTYETSRFYE